MAIEQVPGGTVELRDKPNVLGRELLQQEGFDLIAQLRRKMPEYKLQLISDLRQLPVEKLDRELIAALQRLNRAGVVAFVKAWSFDKPLPTLDNIGELDTDLYDDLLKKTAPLIVKGMFGEDFQPTPATRADPKAPFENSGVSKPGSEEASLQSIGPPIESSNSTGSSDTVEPSPESLTGNT